MTLSERLRRVAAAQPDAPALTVAGETLTYAALFARAETLAADLATLPEGSTVAILGQRDLSAYLGVLACALAGRAFVPVNPGFPEDRQQMILDGAEAAAMIVSPDQALRAAQLAGPSRLYLGEDFSATGALPTTAPQGPRACYMMFTSGTTGRPKGVRVTESNLLAYLDAIAPIAAIGPGDRTSQFFDLSFDLAIHDLFVTWTAGAELIVLPKTESLAIGDFARREKLTHWFSVPSLAAFASRMGQIAPGSLPDLKTVLFCGEPLPVSLAETMQAAAPQARHWNLYGPTEATIAFTAYEIRKDRPLTGFQTVPLGKAIGGQHLHLIRQTAPHGLSELLLGGDQVTPGYLDPEATEKAFTEAFGMRWYRTGDLVRRDPEHGLIFEGRKDDQVKINGYRVELAEIDAVLRAVADTPQVAALPAPTPDGAGREIIAYVAGSTVSAAEIRRACRASLPVYMVPRRVVLLDAMPVTASGKIDRHALRTMEQA
ncbi:AMP-binding protein [Paracoccaceae bacterium GXU_MW_L88]